MTSDHEKRQCVCGNLEQEQQTIVAGDGCVFTSKPTEEGVYLVKCEENDNSWEPVEIIRLCGELAVDDPHVGVNYLDRYHDGLTNIQWKKDSITA